MRNSIFVVILAFFLLGCSSRLTVQVDIFNDKGIDQEDVLRTKAEREGAQHASLLKSGDYAKTKNDIKDQLQKQLNFFAIKEVAILAPGDVSKFLVTAVGEVELAINNAIQQRNEGIRLTRLSETLSKSSERLEVVQDALYKFSSAREVLNKLKTDYSKPYQDLQKRKLIELKAETTPDLTLINHIIDNNLAADRAVSMSVQTLTGGLDLFDDPLAPFIVSAPDNYWKGVFNKTEASGQIGNTDIAIKMETIGTFTIKGVRLDASKVTEASFHVLKQSVKLVAAAYGVPTPGSATPTNAEQSTQSPNATLMNIDTLRQTADLKRKKSQYAALSLLDIIVAQRSALESDNPAVRQSAVKQVKASFEAYKTQLRGQ